MGTRTTTVVAATLCLGALTAGCEEQREDAAQAAEAASALVALAKDSAEAARAAEQAGEAAEAAARAQIPEGTDPAQAKQQVELAKGLAAMKAMGGGGPVVNWRQLKPFVPDTLGDFAAKGEVDGATKKMGGAMSVSSVERSYTAGERRLRLQVSDASMAPMLKAPFAMAAMMEEDTSRGYKKGKKIGGHTAIVEWDEGAKRSKATLLVADRFMVQVTVRSTDTPKDAESVAGALKLGELAALKPEVEDE